VYAGLLLDMGDVILDPWRGLDAFQAATGVTVVDRADDRLWADYQSGRINAAELWTSLAGAAGYPDWHVLMRDICAAVPDELFDPAALALMRDVRTARRRLGILSNDAYAIQEPEFFRSRPEFKDLDAFVDASEIGVRKPEAAAYVAAARALGLEPAAIVFLDDTAECVEGARAVGMAAIRVDPRDRTVAFDQARALLGLK
jgi:FMN phosphatase YigB (HAD superfamily)